MATNPYINKVEFNGTTIIDLTGDTVTANKVAQGYTAHLASGEQITGTLVNEYGEYDLDSQTLSSGAQNLVISDASTTPTVIEAITITTNGTTTAPSGKAYSPVTVSVATGGTATAADILNGKTAYVNGTLITGTCTYNCDTSSDTVTADTLQSGYIAHNSSGERIVGTLAYTAGDGIDISATDEISNSYASSTELGGLKVRYDSSTSTLYITNNGDNA